MKCSRCNDTKEVITHNGKEYPGDSPFEPDGGGSIHFCPDCHSMMKPTPILAKENKQLIWELEQDIFRRLDKFRKDTGLLVTNIKINVFEHPDPVGLIEVSIDRMVEG